MIHRELMSELERRNIKYDMIAKSMGISEDDLTARLNGTAEFRESEIRKLASLLDLKEKDVDRVIFESM